jgi:heme-degrading monooxygenase HmoA
MFVVVIAFPPIKEGKDAEFREWFASSNELFATFKGFIRRRLLKPLEGGNYAAIVEFENKEAFNAMHSSPEHDKAGECVKPLFDEPLAKVFRTPWSIPVRWVRRGRFWGQKPPCDHN